jgi:hypothetical protein
MQLPEFKKEARGGEDQYPPLRPQDTHLSNEGEQ